MKRELIYKLNGECIKETFTGYGSEIKSKITFRGETVSSELFERLNPEIKLPLSNENNFKRN